jgi:hypothetical protein
VITNHPPTFFLFSFFAHSTTTNYLLYIYMHLQD